MEGVWYLYFSATVALGEEIGDGNSTSVTFDREYALISILRLSSGAAGRSFEQL